MRIIGDIHGNYEAYFNIIKDAEYSVQVGDMGFDYNPLKSIDDNHHGFIMGNHDNYDDYNFCSLTLYAYDMVDFFDIPFFYVTGSFSIDCLPRVANYALSGHKTWWYEEQLSQEELNSAVKFYEKFKPDLVITHDCPLCVKDYVSTPQIMKDFGWPIDMVNRTQEALQRMYEIHQPKLWVFGHYHKDWTTMLGKTQFVCVASEKYIDINEDLDIL